MNFSKYFFTFLLLVIFKYGQQLNSTAPSIFNNYFHYNKCLINDARYFDESCDSFQPSCIDDSNCSPGYACCFAGVSNTGQCYSCQGNFQCCNSFLQHIFNLKLI